MGSDDKLSNKGEEAAGKMKEKAGEMTDDERLEAEGRTEKSKAKGKQVLDDAAEKAKGTAEGARDAFKRDR